MIRRRKEDGATRSAQRRLFRFTPSHASLSPRRIPQPSPLFPPPCDSASNLSLDDGSIVASGLANIIVLADQLSLNRLSSYRSAGEDGSDCVVCLSKLHEGEELRKLECGHVFHKRCLEGWLHHLNFTCPLCRWALVADCCISRTQRRVGRNLISCFSLH
ncbi:hypothetical protein F2Q70_00019972 [Brassica cretica]|uniref:RING-type domain-containing protein n=1 Tax=Brassica cretica TaxID=69181 RepID=A0A8S9GL63_BRACR|nr:hypothetical protein F2Q70_00019972 [Brassica cretica]